MSTNTKRGRRPDPENRHVVVATFLHPMIAGALKREANRRRLPTSAYVRAILAEAAQNAGNTPNH
jgi:hypothetical protein